MAERIGVAIQAESDRYAQVVTDRNGACGGCQSTHSSANHADDYGDIDTEGGHTEKRKSVLLGVG
jgi:hypothetical protein